jgi:heme A synthase
MRKKLRRITETIHRTDAELAVLTALSLVVFVWTWWRILRG